MNAWVYCMGGTLGLVGPVDWQEHQPPAGLPAMALVHRNSDASDLMVVTRVNCVDHYGELHIMKMKKHGISHT